MVPLSIRPGQLQRLNSYSTAGAQLDVPTRGTHLLSLGDLPQSDSDFVAVLCKGLDLDISGQLQSKVDLVGGISPPAGYPRPLYAAVFANSRSIPCHPS